MTEASRELTGPMVLLLGDEELLVSRGIEAATAAARQADPATEVSEHVGAALEASALYELLSPSLFGGRRVVVIRQAHDLQSGHGRGAEHAARHA